MLLYLFGSFGKYQNRTEFLRYRVFVGTDPIGTYMFRNRICEELNRSVR